MAPTASARADMCLASLCGGLALANAKLGAVHGIAGPFGGRFKAPHGAVCGRLLPFVTAANLAAFGADEAPALDRLRGGRPADAPETRRPRRMTLRPGSSASAPGCGCPGSRPTATATRTPRKSSPPRSAPAACAATPSSCRPPTCTRSSAAPGSRPCARFSLPLLLAILGAATAHAADSGLVRLVKKIQPAVATVVAYDMERNVAGLGTGFFVDAQGHLITNFHVLQGRYAADVRTAAGKSYPVRAVLAENREADLVKLRVDIPPEEVAWIPIDERVPEIAERVVVVGSPMGLEQTVSEGIVSSVREIPPVGTVFQMSAPISPGSSGSPVVDMKGRVVGIAAFQFVQGQNLNFAVAARQLSALKRLTAERTVSEWTFGHLGQKPRLAEGALPAGVQLFRSGRGPQGNRVFQARDRGGPARPGRLERPGVVLCRPRERRRSHHGLPPGD